MWTPKRILLLSVGFSAFLTLYIGYSWALGGIDGMAPLPAAFYPRAKEDLPPLPPRTTSRVVYRLQQAFGQECPEINRKIKIEINSRSMVFASDQFQVEPDGRVRLAPLSVALFNKDKNEQRQQEINTIRGDVAFLKFDRPIAHLTDIGSRKVVGAEIRGKIEVVNNRKTSARDDDIFIFIPQGPLFYQENKNLIWSADALHLTDNSSKPKPTEIHGQGFEMELMSESPSAGPPQQKKNKGEAIAGVRRIKLLSQVDMHLYIDGNSGFLSSPGMKKEGVAQAITPGQEVAKDKSHITIKTQGTFEYFLQKGKDLAVFDSARAPGTPARDVTVTRFHDPRGAVDQLVCEKLNLELSRKDNADPASGIAREEKSIETGMEILSARATGKEVVLTSESERLEAHGNDFYYDAKASSATLKGAPEMWAIKDGNVLHCPQMTLTEQKADPKIPGSSPYQKAKAIGPGWIEIHEKEKTAQGKPVKAVWTEELQSTREGAFEVLLLRGNAKFINPKESQELSADSLKVWMFASNNENGSKKKDQPQQQGKKLHKVEGVGNVAAVSSDLIIKESGRLTVWFRDPPPGVEIPKNTNPGKSEVPGPASKDKGGPSLLPMDLGNKKADPKEKSKPPIELTARAIEAWIFQLPGKNRFEKVWTEGSVHVTQDPSKDGEKGVDVKGDTLQMTYGPDGNYLVVTGDLAQLRMDRMLIVGPEVNIDQATNKAWVNGVGAMQMESTTNFQGNKLNKPVPLEVHWNKSMFFNGKFAEFHGGIQAEQENSRLACQSMQVFFDKEVSLKGEKTGLNSSQPPRVLNLVCDRNVRVEEIIRQDDRLVKYHRIQSITLSMNRLDRDEEEGKPGKEGNEVRASGPGEVRILQMGGNDSPFSPMSPGGPSPTPAITTSNSKEKTNEVMKLTHVSFLRSMYGNSMSNTATFLENVRVLNFPCENPNIEIDLESILDNLPKGGIYLRCDRLDVLTIQGKGKAQQEMRAKGRVVVQAQEFWGRADSVSYEEAKDLVIFNGGENGLATLYKRIRQGVPPEEIKGKKITYSRLTGMFRIDDSRWLNGGGN